MSSRDQEEASSPGVEGRESSSDICSALPGNDSGDRERNRHLWSLATSGGKRKLLHGGKLVDLLDCIKFLLQREKGQWWLGAGKPRMGMKMATFRPSGVSLLLSPSWAEASGKVPQSHANSSESPMRQI